MFVERSAQLGIHFSHRHFGTGAKYMHETMGSGVALLDADGDGRLDVYFVQGAPIPPAARDGTAVNQLFLQQPDGSFRDATGSSGLGDTGYGMGVTWGDVDADGDPDVYVTNFGRNALYLNQGGARFREATAEAGVGSEEWGASAGFFDADGDSDLDLYVVNYVDFALDNHKFCGDPARKLRAYCHPDVYRAVPDRLYLNDGEGRFRERGDSAGLPRSRDAKGLGLSFADLDDDGHSDVYVANDSTMNFLLLGDGRGHFTESALLAGVGYNASGAAEAGMGVEIGDVDGDGLQDVFVTHLDFETNTLYRSLGGGSFEDVTEAAGLAEPSLLRVGFGTALLDYDADGDLDLFVANGHIIDNIEALSGTGSVYRQPSQLFENTGGGRFREREGALDLPTELVARGVAVGDLDGDGAPDLVMSQNDGPALVLLNRHRQRSRGLVVRLGGPTGNPQGLGARVTVTAGGRRQVRDARSASSYLSQGSADLHFGLGDAGAAAELAVRWPGGRVERHSGLERGFLYTVAFGAARTVTVPFKETRQ